MTTIVVAGVPLQPKIDSAQPGDTLDVRAGSYAGRLKVTKPIQIKGDGAVILEGGTGDGFVNVDVAAKAVTLSGLDLRHAGAAVRFKGDCTGSLVENCTIPVVDWMLRNNGLADNGGNAFQFDHATGIEVRYCDMRLLRAPSKQYTVDGGAFEFFVASKVYVHHNEVWDSVNMAEFGKSQGEADNSDIRIEDNIFHGRANPLTATSDLAKLANGILVRALQRGTFLRNTFDLIDYWSLLFDTGGTYGGGLGALTVKDNVFRLIPGSNRMMATKAGIPLSVFAAFDANKVYTTSTGSRVAEIGATRYYPGDLAKFRTDTGFERTSTWTVGPLPPIGVIEPPVDPCADLRAERDAAIAQATAANLALGTAQGQLAAANAKIAAGRAALA